ncbi:MAG: hypothetical protein HY795_10080 [Desulfovibrio sp.]|nr:hypothetical protein [Desulfovibrio sp.]MBI4959650.1 hypothetical protein [Desulfovibrio sp.]
MFTQKLTHKSTKPASNLPYSESGHEDSLHPRPNTSKPANNIAAEGAKDCPMLIYAPIGSTGGHIKAVSVISAPASSQLPGPKKKRHAAKNEEKAMTAHKKFCDTKFHKGS